MVWVEPRSSLSHCGSLARLDQRVWRLPSVALPAGKPLWVDEAAVAVSLIGLSGQPDGGGAQATLVLPKT